MPLIKDQNFEHLIGNEVGTATLLNELARGGMAVIFVAYQRTLKRQIAVKIMPKSLLTSMTEDLFQQEAESAAILSHPNIVTIYDVGEADSFLYITMQLIKGRSLFEYIKKVRKHVLPSKRFLPVRATLKIVTSILDALDYAHGQDIVHRDIKPANILIETHSKRPIITDFGLAKTTRGPCDESSMISGTPTYMAPEQILNDHIDGRTDIYAVGMMLFELLVSRLPFPQYANTVELLKMRLKEKENQFLKKPSEMNPAIHSDMDAIVYNALFHDPEKRYETCREFIQALEGFERQHLNNRSR